MALRCVQTFSRLGMLFTIIVHVFYTKKKKMENHIFHHLTCSYLFSLSDGILYKIMKMFTQHLIRKKNVRIIVVFPRHSDTK